MRFSRSDSGRPLVFGELLFDVFPDGERVLGGAPFNVAWHLTGFRMAPLFVSRVGRDAEADEIRRRMADWQMDLAGLQVDDSKPTGRVEVSFSRGEPEYRIEADQAYDRIDETEALAAARTAGPRLIYHGSLALRNETSRATLWALRDDLELDAFVDLNLRDPWSPAETSDLIAGAARWVKLNEDELRRMAGDASREEDIESLALACRRRWNLDQLILTRGASGALMATERGLGSYPAAEVEGFVDSVGAGDAFAAVLLLGLIEGWAPDVSMPRAARFAAEICGIRGATTGDIALYDRLLEAWESETP